MTVRHTRILFGVFFAFALAVAVNAIFFQSSLPTTPASRQAAQRAVEDSERRRQERLSLDAEPAPPVVATPKPVAAAAERPVPPMIAPNPTRSVAPKQAAAPAAPRVVAATATAASTDEGAKRFARLRPDALKFGAGGVVDTMPFAPDAEGDPATIAAVQRELSARGYGPLTADGLIGLMTRAAIMAFEHDNALPLTGEATETLLGRILLGAAAGNEESADARRVRGPNAEALVRTVQQSLVALGYPIAKVDGRMGDDTARAIAAFEKSDGLKPKGRVSAEVFGRLARAVAAARVTPIR